MALIAAGNGLGAGIVMTLGADASPTEGRSQFLGAWRLCGDIGNSGGPLLVSAVAAVAPLAVACLTLGVLGLAGAGWVGYWTGRVDRDRRTTRGRGVRAQPTVTVTSLEIASVSVSIDAELVGPDAAGLDVGAERPADTDAVTGKSDHAPFSKRCTWRIAPSPPW